MAKYKSLKARLLYWSRLQRFEKDFKCCRLWIGYTQKDGYISNGEGYGKINLMREGRSLKFAVHRVSKVLEEILSIKPEFNFYDKSDRELFFELYDAYSICSLSIDHLCKNSLCFEPTHLEWVYLSRNQQRKKWGQKKCSTRIQAVTSKNTRHDKLVRNSKTIRELIIKIKAKSYRVKS